MYLRLANMGHMRCESMHARRTNHVETRRREQPIPRWHSCVPALVCLGFMAMIGALLAVIIAMLP